MVPPSPQLCSPGEEDSDGSTYANHLSGWRVRSRPCTYSETTGVWGLATPKPGDQRSVTRKESKGYKPGVHSSAP